ncbi:sugar isomerase domain-containing protein [Micromonospora sp. LZ34]
MTDSTSELKATVRALLADVDEHLDRALPRAATMLLNSVESGGLIYVAGAGHSLAMVCETFYRAGGLACVRPLWHPDVFPLTNAVKSTQAERTAGLGASLVENANLKPDDIAVVFSTSGSNPYPIEIAQGCQDRGVDVVAITSTAAARGAAARAGGQLTDHATVVLDTGVPPGDVTFPANQPRTSAVSTLSASYVWARLLAQIDVEASRRGRVLPTWQSANVPDGDLANETLFARYAPIVPELGYLSTDRNHAHPEVTP